MSNWYSWYRPLDKQILFELREKLIDIAKPSAKDWRNLTVVRANTTPKSKLAKNKDTNGDKEKA